MLSSLPQLSTHDAHTLWYTTTSTTTSHLDQHLQGAHPSVGTEPAFHPPRRPPHSTLANITNTPHHSSQRSTAELLFSLRQSEAFIAQRKLNIQRFGARWIRPPGVAKTYQAAMDEAIEREEQERLLERVGEVGEMEIAEIVDQVQAVQAGQAQAQAGEGVQAAVVDAGQERDLDEEIPDADDAVDDDDDDEIDDEDDDEYETEDDEIGGGEEVLMVEEDEDAEAERDLDDDIPEGGSYQHTDTDISTDDDDDEDNPTNNNDDDDEHDEPGIPASTNMLLSSSSSLRSPTTTATVRSGSTRTSQPSDRPPRRRRGIAFNLEERVTTATTTIGTGAGIGLDRDGRDSTAHLVGSVMEQEEESSGFTMMEDSLLGRRGRGAGRRRGGAGAGAGG